MKIPNELPAPELDPRDQRVGGTQKTARLDPATTPVASGNGDAVVLSPRAKLLLSLSGELDRIPEARSDRLDAISKTVEQSTYQLSPPLLADRILQELSKYSSGI